MSLTADFEAGTTGNTIAATDPGSANAWDAVSVVAGGTLAYDTTHAAHGSQAAKIATGATSGVSAMSWTTSFGTQTDHYGRLYLYLTANPSLKITIVQPVNPSIQIDTAGKILLLDRNGTTQATSTNSVALNQWCRVEFHFVHSTTAGQIQAKLFFGANPDDTTATETLTTAGTINTAANATGITFGENLAHASIAAFWMDDIVAAATSYPGPAGVTAAPDMVIVVE